MDTSSADSPLDASEVQNSGGFKLAYPANVAVCFIGIVSICLSVVTVVAIALPLIRDPQTRTRAASFNVYLIYFSTADLLTLGIIMFWTHRFFRMEWDGTETKEEMQDKFIFPGSVWVNRVMFNFCSQFLVWVVAFVCREILTLLRNSNQRKRCKPPALRTVALHGLVAFAMGITSCLLRFVNWGSVDWGLYVFFYPPLFGPIFYSLWVAYRVVKEGLVKVGAGVGSRLRVLVIYFSRIILVYCVWLGSVSVALALALANVGPFDASTVSTFINLTWTIQGWVSFAVVLTKPDVKKMILDLFSIETYRGKPSPRKGMKSKRATLDTVRAPRISSNMESISSEKLCTSSEKLCISSQMGEECMDEGGGEVEVKRQQEGSESENEDSALDEHKYVFNSFIAGIVDYLSEGDGEDDGDDEDYFNVTGDGEDGDGNIIGDGEDGEDSDRDGDRDEEAS
mmetsp:Transcript_5521/g.12648  ORF Transcript_5521/g.12648 Transcript_5521/m.12648 type:complete len:454 (-) Transcript_5521:1723-3084(-)